MDTTSLADWATIQADALLDRHPVEAKAAASGGPITGLRDYCIGLLPGDSEAACIARDALRHADWRALVIRWATMPEAALSAL